jgi:hypothetical protein
MNSHIIKIDGKKMPWKKILGILTALGIGLFALWNSLPDPNKERGIGYVLGWFNSSNIDYDYSLITVKNRTDTVDLSIWEKSPEQLKKVRISPVKRKTEMKVVKSSSDAKFFRRELFTSGLTPDVVCFTHPYIFTKEKYIPEKGREFLDKYVLLIDISKEEINKPFPMRFQTISWNGFQGETGDWAASLVLHQTENLEIKIIFPHSKLFTDYEVKAYSNESSKLENFLEEPSIIIEGNVKITWLISNPRKKYSYRLLWDW